MSDPASDVTPLPMANAIRVLAMDAVNKAKSGHQGMPLGMADVATALWTGPLKYDPAEPQWPDRDRFVLSAGHGSMLLYALLHLTGYPGMTMAQIERFRQLGSMTPGHPEAGHTPGVEVTTGPLGQGLAMSVGLAMAERSLAARFGADLVDHRTWVIAGDGCLMEGVSHEAIHLAGRLRLAKLTVLYDDNNVTIDGRATLAETGDQVKRFEAAGWAARRVDGHDRAAIDKALAWAIEQERPSLIACKTIIDKGAGPKEGDPKGHGYSLFDADIAKAREAMAWPWPPFTIPEDIASAWRAAGARGAPLRQAWEARLAACAKRSDFAAAMAGDVAGEADKALGGLIDKALAEPKAAATRACSGDALAALLPAVPELLGGSADLTESNNTEVKGETAFDAPDYTGRYIHFGIREFGMASALNGLAAHGGITPYGGTFLVFSDYSRPAIRLAALMGVRVIHVMTHDSIGVGEDGPTHQPIEQLAALRAMPNLMVFRPADAVETAECWKAALAEAHAPSVLALSRQKTPAVRTRGGDLARRGAYELAGAPDGLGGAAKASLFASGTEVALALEARDRLAAAGVAARVVSCPCFELFARQSAAYHAEVIGAAPVRLAVEAGVRQGWDRFIGDGGLFVGMSGFGESAPASDLYRHFEITADAIVAKVLAAI